MRRIASLSLLAIVLTLCLPGSSAQRRRRTAIRGNSNRAAIGAILGGSAGTGVRARSRHRRRTGTRMRAVVEREQLDAVKKSRALNANRQ